MRSTPESIAFCRTELLRELQRTRSCTGKISPISPQIHDADLQIAQLVGWDEHKRLLEFAESQIT